MTYRPSTSFVDKSNKNASDIKERNDAAKAAILLSGKVECECGRNYIDPKKYSVCFECYTGR